MSGVAMVDGLLAVERRLRQDPYLHLYGLGDLDAPFRDRTTWYGRCDGDELAVVALLYRGVDPPALLALDGEPLEPIRDLLRQVVTALPSRLQCHLSPGLSDVLADRYSLSAPAPHLKMGLTRPERLDRAPRLPVYRLGDKDGEALGALYSAAYPDNAYDPSLLSTGRFWGIRLDGRLVSAAGIHVYSTHYRVAALGSIATHPDHRGHGLAKAVTAALCRDLLPDVDHIGLNVRADNDAAIACYRALGFVHTHDYVELAAYRQDDAADSPGGI